MPLGGMRTVEDFYYGNAVAVALAMTRITGGMGLMGLLLAMVGLYGLVAYAVARPTREIGIRLAVGAKPSLVLRSVLRHGLLLAGSGIALGVVACVAAVFFLIVRFPPRSTLFPYTTLFR